MTTSRPVSRIRGVVILYATIAVGMLGVLGTTMSDGTQATIDAVQAAVFTQMARYAAESGVEAGISALDAHLATECPTFEPDGSGGFRERNTPNRNPLCDLANFTPCRNGRFTIAWADAGTEDLCPTGEPKGALMKMHPSTWDPPNTDPGGSGIEADRERVARAYVTSFALSMSPAFNHENVYRRLRRGEDAVFALRSRGMVRGGPDPDVQTSRVLLGHAVLVAKIRVSAQTCNGRGRIERISMDLVPSYDRSGTGGPAAALPAVTLPH